MQKFFKSKLALWVLFFLLSGIIIAQHGINKVGDYEQANPVEVFGYVSTPSATACADENTYYHLQGTFTNPILECFEIVSDTITYKCELAHYVTVNLSGSYICDKTGVTVTVAAKKNGVLISGSQQSVFLKVINESQTISNNFTVTMEYNDNISIWVSHNYTPGTASITANTLTATLHALR